MLIRFWFLGKLEKKFYVKFYVNLRVTLISVGFSEFFCSKQKNPKKTAEIGVNMRNQL